MTTTLSRNKAILLSSTVFWLASPACLAAAPLPFDMGELVFYCALYLLGFVVFPLVIGFSKEDEAKRFWSWVYAVHSIGPIICIFAILVLGEMRKTRRMEQEKAGAQKNLEAFGNYCRGRKPIVHSKSYEEDGVSLLVRTEKDFKSINTDLLFEYFGKNPDLCARSGVKTLENIHNIAYLKDKIGYEAEVRRYAMCTNERRTVVPEVQSRFELVLGQTVSKDPVPRAGAGHWWWMSRSSVQIIDRLTGKILAEDTMYFLEHETGVGGCPEGLSQLSNLVAEVFGRY